MWFRTKSASYSDNLDLLIPLICHLGYTDWNMRSTKMLAKATGATEDRVVEVLERFSSLFLKVQLESPKGLVYYQLHVRRAMRWMDDLEDESRDPSLPPPVVNALIDFVTKAADHERRHNLGVQTALTASVVAVVVSLLRWIPA